MSVTNDPFQSAVDAADAKKFVYGQASIRAEYVKLVKGVGKTPFNPDTHEIKERVTNIAIVVNPLAETGMTKLFTREVIAEFDEWVKIVWPSLRLGCGLSNPRELDGKFVKLELVPNGRPYKDKITGEPKEGTTFKFHAMFTDESSCLSAMRLDEPEMSDSDATGAMSVDMSSSGSSAPEKGIAGQGGAIDDNERKTAASFLPALVKVASGNVEMLKGFLNSNPMLAKYFSVESPEVQALMVGA